ncbi:unnamed protein product [Trypanosoma congolense IL3000]|uniref:WGS project CAEQ00000000 data, annotated contig 474 n=1 Tax=Trypanosoma congolense (strain IL3000) TaxID=1068625 RepID=F9WG79_TRYCI|nr:unnamed protein product [Trypanosoma congolense IL3000]
MALSCMEALATRRKGRAGGAANVPANGVTETNQTAASFRHPAIGGLSVASSVGHPNERNPMNAAFVAIKPQKPKLARALEKRQVHAELQKAKSLKPMGERGCQTVTSLSEAASRHQRRVAGYLPQHFACSRSFIGMRRSNTEAEQHLAGTTDATAREV